MRLHVPRIAWAFAALALILLFNLLFTDGFFRLETRDGRLYGSLVDILDRATPLVLVTLGMTLIIGTAGVDLSVGSVMAIAGVVAAALITRFAGAAAMSSGGAFVLAVLVALAASALLGLGNGALVSLVGVQPIVATLILMVAGRGIAQLLSGGQIITVRSEPLAFLGNGAWLGLPAPIAVLAGATLAVGLLARATALGLFVEATGDNPVAARYAGLPVRAVLLGVYGLGGLLAGGAGIVAAADVMAADANNAGLYIELDAILAVVIGGTSLAGGRFSILGSVVGALIIQSMTTTILSQGVPVQYTLIVKAVIVVGVCLLQSPRLHERARRLLRGAAA